jgi:hypothetical protein
MFPFFSEWQVGEILQKIRVHAEIKKLAMTLYLDDTNLVSFPPDLSNWIYSLSLDWPTC